MSEVSLKVIRYTFFFAIALILIACIKPVDISPFLGDGRVQYIIEGDKTGVKIGITTPVIVDIPPELEWTDGGVGGAYNTLLVGEDIPVSSGGGIIVRVANASAGYTSIEWYCNGVLVCVGPMFSITEGVAPFNVTGASRYLVTVEGIVGGVPYNTVFYVVVN